MPAEDIHQDWIDTYESQLNRRQRPRGKRRARMAYMVKVAAEEKKLCADDAKIMEEDVARSSLQQLEKQ